MTSAEALLQPSIASLHFIDRDDAAELAVALDGEGIVLRRFAAARSAQDLLHQMAQAFAFPEYVGHNWDGCEEALCDLEWLDPPAAVVLLVEEALQLWTEAPRLAAMLTEVWLSAADEWRVSGVPFHLVFVW